MNTCACVCVCMCVCARLAAGSWTIMLYEVWQGESKTSASLKKSPGLGVLLGLGNEHTTCELVRTRAQTHTHRIAIRKTCWTRITQSEAFEYVSLDLGSPTRLERIYTHICTVYKYPTHLYSHARVLTHKSAVKTNSLSFRHPSSGAIFSDPSPLVSSCSLLYRYLPHVKGFRTIP